MKHRPALVAPYAALLPFALADVPLALVLPVYALSAMAALMLLSAVWAGKHSVG